MKLFHSLVASSNRRLQYQKNLPYSTEVQWDIFDLPFIQYKDCQYQVIPTICLYNFEQNIINIYCPKGNGEHHTFSDMTITYSLFL